LYIQALSCAHARAKQKAIGGYINATLDYNKPGLKAAQVLESQTASFLG